MTVVDDGIPVLIGWAVGGVIFAATWLLAVLAPFLLARLLSELVVASPLVIAVVLLLIWFGFFCYAVSLLGIDKRRRDLWGKLRWGAGRSAPFVYAFVMAELAIALFATLAFVLADHEVIRFGTDVTATISEPADALDFFAWHLLDSIPVLKVNETLRWEEPLGYTDSGTGFLLLVFKVVAIVPIVAGFAAFWRYSRQPKGTGLASWP